MDSWLHAAVLASARTKCVPTAQAPTAAQDQLQRTFTENHFSSERKIKVSVQDDAGENS